MYSNSALKATSATASIAATNSSTIHSALPNTGAQTAYSVLGNITLAVVAVLAVVAIVYKIRVSRQSKARQ